MSRHNVTIYSKIHTSKNDSEPHVTKTRFENNKPVRDNSPRPNKSPDHCHKNDPGFSLGKLFDFLNKWLLRQIFSICLFY